MADFTTKLFLSSSSEVPSYPPYRFRLPNGQTRYASSCSQEDLNSAGFEGPFELPDLNKNQNALWDNATKTFLVVDNVDSVDWVLEDKRARQYLSSVIDSVNSLFREDLTTSFLLVLNDIKNTAFNLLSSSDLLRTEDIPSFDLPAFTSTEIIQKYIDESFVKDKDFFKYTYENYGFIAGLTPELLPYFVPPSGWVLDAGTMVNQRIYSFPEGHTVYDESLLASGQKQVLYTVDPGTTVLSGYDPTYGVIISTSFKFF